MTTSTPRAPSAESLVGAMLGRLDRSLHCPTSSQPGIDPGSDIFGCGSRNISFSDGGYDCLNCGLTFSIPDGPDGNPIRPLHATVKIGNVGGPDVYWASCAACQWWTDNDHGGYLPEVDAQAAADDHNRTHHGGSR